MANFTGQPISASYLRLLQIDGGAIQDGLGSTISNATIGSLTGSFSGSLRGTATTASFAITASYALNAGGGTGVGFPFTGSARITGSLGVTGSLTVVSSFAASASNMNISATNFLVTSGETYFTGSSGKGFGSVTFGNKTALDLRSIDTGSGFSIPLQASTVPTTGSMYYDDAANVLYIYNSTNGWQGFEPTI